MHINLALACISFSLNLWNRDTLAQNFDDETVLINPEAFGCFGSPRSVNHTYHLPLLNYTCISFTIARLYYDHSLTVCQLSLMNISIELKLPSKEVIVGLNRSMSDAIVEKFPILKAIRGEGSKVDGWLEKEGNDYYVFSLTDLSVKRLSDSDVLSERFGFCSYSAACKPPVINESAWMPSCGDGKERLYDYKQQIPCNCPSDYILPRDQYSAECNLNGWRIPVCQSTSSTVARPITAATEVLDFTTGEQNTNTATNEQRLSATPGSQKNSLPISTPLFISLVVLVVMVVILLGSVVTYCITRSKKSEARTKKVPINNIKRSHKRKKNAVRVANSRLQSFQQNPSIFPEGSGYYYPPPNMIFHPQSASSLIMGNMGFPATPYAVSRAQSSAYIMGNTGYQAKPSYVFQAPPSAPMMIRGPRAKLYPNNSLGMVTPVNNPMMNNSDFNHVYEKPNQVPSQSISTPILSDSAFKSTKSAADSSSSRLTKRRQRSHHSIKD